MESSQSCAVRTARLASNAVQSAILALFFLAVALPLGLTAANAADTRPPTVTITAPATGAIVSGTITVRATASDNRGIAGVQFKYNGINLGVEDTTSPYTVSTNTTTIPNGSYVLTAVARDRAGNRTTSAPVTITVSNKDTTPPMVGITSPASGSTVAGTITVTVSASDNVGVAGVQFKYDGANLGAEVTTAPYSISWNTTTASGGSHNITAVARDAAGNLTTSAPVTVMVAAMSEYIGVDVGAPALAGRTSVVSTGSDYDVTAAGSDIYGTSDQFHFAYKVQSGDFDLRVRVSSLTQADVWSKAGLMARESLAPDSREVSVLATPAGGYEFQYRTETGVFVQKTDSVAQVSYPNTWVRLRRQDNEFTSYTSADGANWVQLGTTTLVLPDSVFVGMAATSHNVGQSIFAQFRDLAIVPPSAPTVSITSPASGVTVSNTISMTANASDNVGVAGVQFQVDGINASAEVTTAPYASSWNTTSAANGSHILTAIARDTAGNRTTSAPIAITVSNKDTTPPTVGITSPVPGSIVGGTVIMIASVSDNVGVVGVQFKYDGINLGAEITSAPFSVAVNTITVPNGSHVLTAVARDAAGNMTPSAPVAITVSNGPPPDTTSPTIGITSPGSGATVSGTITVTANVSDNVGVAGVQFKYDGINLGAEITSAPFSVAVNTITAQNGPHVLTAVARDAAGNHSTSTPVTITVSNDTTPPLPAQNAKAIATFESLGLYWTPPSDPGAAGCSVRFRKAGESAWKDGLAMWYDARNTECRGSLVHLSPGTSYEMQFAVPGQAPVAQITANTWSEAFPIAQTVYLANGTMTQTLAITQGGSPSGYVLYTFPPGGQTTIDVANARLNNITISAPYVIVRGLTLRGAQEHGVVLLDGAHDVVIEYNDISGWGRYAYTNSVGWQIGVDWADGAAGVFGNCSATPGAGRERTIIQRNRIHHPRYGASSWDWGHPSGPQAIGFIDCGGNSIFRYNEIYSDGTDQRRFNDGMGGASNFSSTGFPGADSDIYGNIIMHTWEDGIEAEGGGRNVRVWGNYLDRTTTGVSSTATQLGPIYIFRNVYNRARTMSQVPLDLDIRSTFAKSGTSGGWGGGRRYLFHNTLLQAPPPPGTIFPLGAGRGINMTITNTVSRNNIFHVWQYSVPSIEVEGGTGNDFNYDLYNGVLSGTIVGTESNGIAGTPVYAVGNGWSSESGGLYSLAPGSPGYDQGARIPNFNDGFLGAGPDIGAHETGSPAMSFGVNAVPTTW